MSETSETSVEAPTAVVEPTAVDQPTSVAAPTSDESAAPDAPGARSSHRKTREGYVVSDKMDKTVVVQVEDRVKHPLYGKVIRRTNKLKAHDSSNEVGVGDRVLIMETRPLSATKRWRVVQVLERAK
jgi:small subunit ribosomal protein S17